MLKDRANKIVERPLTPAVLDDIGVLGAFPSPGKGPDRLYRIWLCHGFYGQLNLDAGYLKLTRGEPSTDGSFSLTVLQKQVNWEGIVNHIDARIECAADKLSTPIRWEYTSIFSDRKGADIPALSAQISGRRDGSEVIVTRDGKETIIKSQHGLSADWCIFDAVSRLTASDLPLEFDLMEGLTILKPGQNLRHLGRTRDGKISSGAVLNGIVQTGTGVLPWEYWLDDTKRLCAAISGDRTYILDDKAVEIFDGELAKHREGGYSWQNKL